jgi:PAS domain S-box-containing protein
MNIKPTYEELKQRIEELEKESIDLKQIEKELRKSEDRYRALFENMIDGVAVYEAQGNGEDFIFVDLNKAGETISATTKHDVIGQSVLKIFPGVKDIGLFDVFHNVWKTGQPMYHPMAQYIDDRVSHWIENSVFKLPSGEIVAVYSNETERKLAEEALRESKERIETLLFSLPTGIVIIDSETHKIIDANPQAILMIGIPLEHIIGSKCHRFICPADEGECPITDHGQTIDKSERMLLTASGERIPVIKSVIPFTIDDRKCFIECFIDISEHKIAEQERMKKEKLEGIIEMAGAVCHEMNQPLLAISGYSELISMNISRDDPLYEKLSKIKEQSYKLGEITQKLMGITRYETREYLQSKIIDIDKSSKGAIGKSIEEVR